MTPEERRVVESSGSPPIDVTEPAEEKEYSFLPKYMGRA